MQSRNIKSIRWAGVMVILLAFFVCLGLKGEDIYAAQQSKPAKVLEKWVKPFTVFYVYQRASVGGEPWLEVGLSNTEGAVGWIKGSQTSDWNQALTLVFSERTGRQPALFLKDLKSLQKIAGSSSPGEQAAQLASQFAAIQSKSISPPAQFPVLAVEPPEEAVPRKRFYLIPIFHRIKNSNRIRH
jgi:serine/threonine-protein kinase PpkA